MPAHEAHPRHFGASFVAHIADAYFESLQEALDAASNGPVVLLRNTTIRHDLHITNRKTTLDLAGYSLMAEATQSDRLPTFTISAPNARIYNGVLGLNVQVLTPENDAPLPASSLELANVQINLEQGEQALLVHSSSVIMRSSRLTSTTQGIVTTGERSFLSIASSRINATSHGVVVQDGACHIKDTNIHSTQACGLLLEGGYTLVSLSDVSSKQAFGLATQVGKLTSALPRAVIKSKSEVSSAGSVALNMQCGEVLVEHAHIRSTAATSIRVGTNSGNDSASLTLSSNTEVTSWGGHGVHVLSGDLINDGAQIHTLRGQHITWDHPLASAQASTSPHEEAAAVSTEQNHARLSTAELEIEQQVSQMLEDIYAKHATIDAKASHADIKEQTTAQNQLQMAHELGPVPAMQLDASFTESNAQELDDTMSLDIRPIVAHKRAEHSQVEATSAKAEPTHEPEPEPGTAPNPDPEPEPEPAHAHEHKTETHNRRLEEQNEVIDHIRLQGVTTNLSHRRPVAFTAALDTTDAFSIHMEIMLEQWTNGSEVITSLSPGTPTKGEVYRYVLTIRARRGYEFAAHPDLYYEGRRQPYKALMSKDLKMVIIHWGLESKPHTIKPPRLSRRHLFA